MKYINETFDEERALYGCRDVELQGCRFDGPADGESALKEGQDISVKDCYFNLRYPFWHDTNLSIDASELTVNCRAALWYSDNVTITDSKLHGIKALRECSNVRITGTDIISPEFGWAVKDVYMKDCTAQSEYFMLRSERLNFENLTMKAKYSFQYVKDSVFTLCSFDTKDCLWHAKNVLVKDCTVKGEYLAWYCENVTFENCTIIGTQPLCYCKGLKLINCKMLETDLAFEKSDVEATVTTVIDSIKNPASGHIYAPGAGEIIRDDPASRGEIILG